MRVAIIILALACLPASISQTQPWPAAPPRIGQLSMPQIYWDWTMEAAREHGVSPYVIQGFMAIESRYDPAAMSGRGRCIGLMQLDRGVARRLGVDPWNPRENIHGGARVLAALLKKHRGNLPRAARAYNGPGCPTAYVREVLRAVRQAEKTGVKSVGQ
ncbi:MAG: lytic transglycosylase domain-containing protein [Proteobacteria bacterium]|nr:lytic transglycosylase domain-containing protein [Pseudomonadota bacterium]